MNWMHWWIGLLQHIDGSQNTIRIMYTIHPLLCIVFFFTPADLTHWGLNKMADILKRIFSNAIYLMKMSEISTKFHCMCSLRSSLLYINIGWGNDLMPSGIKPLPQLMLTYRKILIFIYQIHQSILYSVQIWWSDMMNEFVGNVGLQLSPSHIDRKCWPHEWWIGCTDELAHSGILMNHSTLKESCTLFTLCCVLFWLVSPDLTLWPTFSKDQCNHSGEYEYVNHMYSQKNTNRTKQNLRW